MKQIVLFISFFVIVSISNVFGGDDICNATEIDLNDELTEFDNTLNTNSTIVPPPFGGYVGPDTWIEFEMPVGPLYLTIEELSLINPAIAIYEGPCTDPKLLYNVLDNNCDGSESPALLIENLEPGETYYLRIWPENGSQNGTFLIGFSDMISTIPNFETYEDAFINGDCITLTPQQGGQQGCAWYQIPIDFNFSFTHTMTANFGVLNGNGADGICLVYQSAGPNFCGGTGSGIGAGGMPNSAIFEFDTWQNGFLNDPVDDHTSLNINGDMNHANSIEGPVVLGNIEDGLDHTLTFEWNPIGNQYTLFFDGMIVLSGSFDFITNCFGGENLAYWGYTSATGGSTNLHVICPEVEEYLPSTIDYLEIDLCAGGSYNGFTESGYYTELVNGPNGCLHQNNILLNIEAASPPNFIDTIICYGESVVVNNQIFSEPFLYLIETQTDIGCDSSIILDLEVIELEVAFDSMPFLSCNFSEIEIGPSIESNVPEDQISYLWSQNGETTESIFVNTPGDYTVFVSVEIDGVTCQSFETISISAEDEPVIESLDDIFLDCETSDSTFILTNNTSTINSEVTWFYDNTIVSTNNSTQVVNPGQYIFFLQDTISGCSASDTVNVVASDEQPMVSIEGQELNCELTEFIPEVTTSNDVVEFNWFLDSFLVSNTEEIIIDQGGTYVLQVQNANGCSSQTQIEINQDTIAPEIDIPNGIILCDENSVTIYTDLSFDNFYGISDPENIDFNPDSITFNAEGEYIINAINPINECFNPDTILITSLGDSPEIVFISDTLNCNTTSFPLTSITNQSGLIYEWAVDGSIISQDSLVSIDSPSIYYHTVTTATGCSTTDSILIIEDLSAPIVNVSSDTIDCEFPSTILQFENEDFYSTIWTDEENNVFNSSDLVVNQPGVYFVDVENIITGCHTYDTIEVISNSIFPDYSIMNGNLDCNQTSLELDFTINNNYETLNWSGPSQFQSTEINPTIEEDGVYNIFVDLGGGCIIDTFIIISEDFESPNLDIIYDTITCNKNLADISLIGENSSVINLINPEDNTINDITSYSTDLPGEYMAIVIGENGCSDSIIFEILAFTSPPSLDIAIPDPITCINTTAEIDATSLEAESFSWSGPDDFLAFNSTITAMNGGQYLVVVEDSYGCTNSATINVEEFLDLPEIDITGGSLNCEISETTIVLDGEGIDDLIEWRLNGDFISDQQNISVNQEGYYYCFVTNEYGCTSIDSFFVNENIEYPNILPITETDIVFFPTENEKDIIVDVNSNVDYSLSWIPENAVSCSDCESTILNNSTIDSLIVIVNNIYGCMDTLVFQIRSEYFPQVMVPNVFTPNDDGNNDFFTLFANDKIQEIVTMLIYDRWGNKVEENNNFLPNQPNLGWDGKLNDLNVVAGVYAYYFKVLLVDGEEIEVIGDVTVMR